MGAVHNSPAIYLTAEENSGKLQLGDRLMKVVRPVIASNVITFGSVPLPLCPGP